MDMDRRRLLAGAMAGAGAVALAGPALGWPAPALRPTPEQTTGPFYPIPDVAAGDLYLTRIGARRASGQAIAVEGVARLPDGRPAAGIVLVAWQANAAGRYRHPGDPSAAALDPGFAGQGATRTDARGRFRLLTIKPGAYAIAGGGQRTPHIHWDFIAPQARLVTQSYFPGEATNARDALIARLVRAGSDPAAVTMRPLGADAAGRVRYAWEVVLTAS
ncbi:MAG: hypothetical protein ACK40H_07485 [Sphingomonadaceae bacterium]